MVEKTVFFLTFSIEKWDGRGVVHLTHFGSVRRLSYCPNSAGVLTSQITVGWYENHPVLTVGAIHTSVCGISKIYLNFF